MAASGLSVTHLYALENLGFEDIANERSSFVSRPIKSLLRAYRDTTWTVAGNGRRLEVGRSGSGTYHPRTAMVTVGLARCANKGLSILESVSKSSSTLKKAKAVSTFFLRFVPSPSPVE